MAEPEECSLTDQFGQTVQFVLGFLVLIVMSTEYGVELLIAKCKGKQPRRDFVQFWFDTFKICVGAAVSHIYNVMIAIYLHNHEAGADECALYAIAFVYEGSGVPFVQLLTYSVVKFAETKARTSRIFKAISAPGKYNHASVFDYLKCGNSKFQKILLVSLAFAVLNFVVGLVAKMGNIITYCGPIFTFCLFFSCLFSTYEARIQILAWTCIKGFEKGVWTAFVVAQAGYFREWSHDMEIKSNPHLEAVLYVCLIPIVMNVFMFFMFSRISRLHLPCITVKSRSDDDNRQYDVKEAIKVGIVFCLMVNIVIWLIAVVTFRTTEVALVTLVTVLVLPLLMSALFILLSKWLVNRSFAQQTSDDLLVNEVEDAETGGDSAPFLAGKRLHWKRNQGSR